MNALRTKLSTYAIALLISFGFNTSANAGSENFAGIYGGLYGTVTGVELDGTHTDNDAQKTRAQAGGVAAGVGFEAGVSIPLGDVFFVSIGGSWLPGKAKIGYSDSSGDGAGDNTDTTLFVSDYMSYYIQPSISIWDNAAVYAKIGSATMKTTAHGDVTGTLGDVSGDTWAVGTQVMSEAGLYMKAEAGATQMDQFRITGVSDSSTSSVEASPLLAYGSVAIGYKF